MVTAFACMVMTAKSESRSVVIVLRSQLWILRKQENDFSASVLSIYKTVRILRSSLSFGRSCCLRVVYLWGDRDGFTIRHASCRFQPTQFVTFERWRQGIRWPHFSCSTWASSKHGSRMNTDGFLKWAQTAQASRGVWGHASPVHLLDFNSPKFPFLGFFFLSHSVRIFARVQLGFFSI